MGIKNRLIRALLSPSHPLTLPLSSHASEKRLSAAYYTLHAHCVDIQLSVYVKRFPPAGQGATRDHSTREFRDQGMP